MPTTGRHALIFRANKITKSAVEEDWEVTFDNATDEGYNINDEQDDETTNNRFEQLLQQKDVSAYKVAKETGITQASLSDWKTGKPN